MQQSNVATGERTAQDGPGALIETATNLRKAGELKLARDLLLASCDWTHPQIATLAIVTLAELEEAAELQRCLTHAIAKLPDLGRVGAEYLLFLHRRAEQCCLDAHARAPLFSLITARALAGMDAPDSPLGRAWHAGQQRRSYGAAFKARGPRVSFVPLGLNCLPWVLINRWGLQSAEEYRRNLGPFAMAVHTLAGVMSALETNFAGYAAADQVNTIAGPSGRAIVMRQDRGATWVHHENPYFMSAGYSNLAAHMQARIEDFRTACAAPAPVFLINYVNFDYPNARLHFLPRLKQSLAAFTGRQDCRVIMTNVITQHEGEQVYEVDPQTCFCFCTQPYKGYEWNQEVNLDTETALAFERMYVGRIVSCLERWGLV